MDTKEEEQGRIEAEAAAEEEVPAPEVNTEDLVHKAHVAAERLEKANAETKKLLDRQAKANAEVILSGRAAVGSKRMTKEEREIANAREALKGTGYEEDLFPTKE